MLNPSSSSSSSSGSLQIPPKKKNTISFNDILDERSDSGKQSELLPYEKDAMHRSNLEKQFDDYNSEISHKQAKHLADVARKEGYSLPSNSCVKDLTQYFDPDYCGIDEQGIRYEPVQDEDVNRNTYYNTKNRRPNLPRQNGVRDLRTLGGGISKSKKNKQSSKSKKNKQSSKSKKNKQSSKSKKNKQSSKSRKFRK